MKLQEINLFIIRHEAACILAGYALSSIIGALIIAYAAIYFFNLHTDEVAMKKIPHVYKMVEEERMRRIVAEAGERDAMLVLQGDRQMISPIDGKTAKVANVEWSKPRTLVAGLDEGE